MLFGERSRAPDRTQRDYLSGAFHFQVIARLQAEFFPQWLRNHDATSFVQSKADVHNGMLPWVNPQINAI